MEYHSVALMLFRPSEDALDLLAAVMIVAGAAERWQSGDLKAGNAASLSVKGTMINLSKKTLFLIGLAELTQRIISRRSILPVTAAEIRAVRYSLRRSMAS